MLIFDPTTDATQFTLRRQFFAPAWAAYVVYKQHHAILYAVRPFHFLKLLRAWCAAVGTGALIVAIAFTIGQQLPPGRWQPLIGLFAIFGCVIAIFVIALPLSPPKHLIFWRDEARFDLQFEAIQLKRWGFPQPIYHIQDRFGHPIGSIKQDSEAWNGYDQHGALVATAVPPRQPLAWMWFLLGVFLPVAHAISATRLGAKRDLFWYGQRLGTVKRTGITTTIDLVNSITTSLDRRIVLVLSLLS
jgi:hypothetical protein